MSGLVSIRTAVLVLLSSTVGYLAFLGLLAIPTLQNQVIYLNKVTLTWFQDVNVPEQWGFLRGQVTPFQLKTADGETLHAWHILPLGIYQRHEDIVQKEPAGLALDITMRTTFQLLRDDPDALLVLYFHGAAGTLGSGYRPPSYRAITSAMPDRIHVVAIDYRGYGTSTGQPSEAGLLTDALTLADWAIKDAGIPPHRVVLFGQSLGTGVTLSMAQNLASQPAPTLFAGIVLVAPMLNVERLTETYSIAGTIPLLSPIARFPTLLAFFNTLIISKWPSSRNIADLVHRCEENDVQSQARRKYHITLIHAEDDYDIPWVHSEQLYWHAVNATLPAGIAYDELELHKKSRRHLGAGGWSFERETANGVLREEIAKYGLHDRIMGYPIVSSAIWRTFQAQL